MALAGHKPNRKSGPFVTTNTESCHLRNTAPALSASTMRAGLSLLLHAGVLEVVSPGAPHLHKVLWRLWSSRSCGLRCTAMSALPQSHSHNRLRPAEQPIHTALHTQTPESSGAREGRVRSWCCAQFTSLCSMIFTNSSLC